MHNRDKRERYEELPVTSANYSTNPPPAKRQKTVEIEEIDFGYFGEDAQEFGFNLEESEVNLESYDDPVAEMMTAAFYGDVENFKMLQARVEDSDSFMPINWWTYVDNYGRNMLHLAAHSQDGGVMINHIISSLPSDINASLLEAKPSDGLTPVMYAALFGDIAGFSELANNTLNWEDHRTSKCDNILHLAAQNQNSDLILKKIFERLGQEKFKQLEQEKNSYGETPSDVVERLRYQKLVELCQQKKTAGVRQFFKSSNYSQRQKAIAYNHFQPLLVAISSGSEDLIDLLLKATSKRLLSEFFSNPEYITALSEVMVPRDFNTLNFFAKYSPQELINKFFIKNPDSIGAGLSFFISEKNLEAIKSILQLLTTNNSIDPTLITEILNKKAYSILTQAVNAKNADLINLIITLTRNFVSKEQIDFYPFSYALSVAASDGYADLIKLFNENFSKDEYAEILRANHLNAFEKAVRYRHTECVNLLIETYTDEMREQLNKLKYEEVFKVAIENSDTKMVELLLAHCPDSLKEEILQMHETSKFIQACKNADVAALNAFFKKHPLTQIEKIMEEREYADFIKAADGGHVEVVKFLLQGRSDELVKKMLTEFRYVGNTALIAAAWNGHIEVVKFLLQGRSDELVKKILTATYFDGATALMMAAWSGNIEVVKFLLEGRSDELVKEILTATSKQGDTALIHAAYNGYNEVVKFLLEGRSNEIVKKMLTTTNKYRKTCLLYAASGGHVEVVKFLLEGRSNELVKEMLTASDHNRNTALMLAADGGYVEVVKFLLEGRSNELVKEILTATDNKGNTALMLATKQNEAEVVKMLIEKCPQEILAQMIRGDNFKYLLDTFNNSDCFHAVECLLGIIEEKFTVNGANQMLSSAVLALNDTPYRNMNYVVSMIEQRKEMKRHKPNFNIDEFYEHTVKLSKNPDLAKLLLTCTKFDGFVVAPDIKLIDDLALNIIDMIAGFKTNRLVINAQLLSIQSVMLSAEYDLTPGSREFCYKVRDKYNSFINAKKKGQNESFSLSV